MIKVESQVGRYIIAGAIAYVFEMAALFGLRVGFGFSPVQSVAISFWVGFAVAFILQKLVAFKNYDRRAHALAGQLAGYSLLVAWNYIFTLIAVKLFSSAVSVFVVRTVVILIVTGWNFVIYRHLFKLRQVIKP